MARRNSKYKANTGRAKSKASARHSHSKICDKLDINTCSKTSLRSLRVSARAVEAIIGYREKFKCFTHVNELLRLKDIDAETFKLLHSSCKVEKTPDELRDMLHRRRRVETRPSRAALRRCKSRTGNVTRSRSRNDLYTSKSDPTCERVASSRKSSLPTFSSSASIISSQRSSMKSSDSEKTKPTPSRSIASMLTSFWRGSSQHEITKSKPTRSSASADVKKSRSLSKLGSDIVTSISSRLPSLKKAVRGASSRRSSISTAKWVSDARKRTRKAVDRRSRTRTRSKRNLSKYRRRRSKKRLPQNSSAQTEEKKEKCVIM